jgi:hypothetical protein
VSNTPYAVVPTLELQKGSAAQGQLYADALTPRAGRSPHSGVDARRGSAAPRWPRRTCPAPPPSSRLPTRPPATWTCGPPRRHRRRHSRVEEQERLREALDLRNALGDVVSPCPYASSPDATWASNTPELAVDGDSSTWRQPTGEPGTKTIEVTLPDPVSLSSIHASFYSTDYTFTDYTIQTWNGTSWDTAATITGNTSAEPPPPSRPSPPTGSVSSPPPGPAPAPSTDQPYANSPGDDAWDSSFERLQSRRGSSSELQSYTGRLEACGEVAGRSVPPDGFQRSQPTVDHGLSDHASADANRGRWAPPSSTS